MSINFGSGGIKGDDLIERRIKLFLFLIYLSNFKVIRMWSRQEPGEFKKVASVLFCEKVGKRYTMEVTTVNGEPYVNMAAYKHVPDKGWKHDCKKNYFMPADVFMILFSKWTDVSRQICEKLNSCMRSIPIFKQMILYFLILFS